MLFFKNGINAADGSRFSLSSSDALFQNTGFSFINNTLVVTKATRAITYGIFSSGIIRIDVTAANVSLHFWDQNSRGFGYVAGMFIGNHFTVRNVPMVLNVKTQKNFRLFFFL